MRMIDLAWLHLDDAKNNSSITKSLKQVLKGSNRAKEMVQERIYTGIPRCSDSSICTVLSGAIWCDNIQRIW